MKWARNGPRDGTDSSDRWSIRCWRQLRCLRSNGKHIWRIWSPKTTISIAIPTWWSAKRRWGFCFFLLLRRETHSSDFQVVSGVGERSTGSSCNRSCSQEPSRQLERLEQSSVPCQVLLEHWNSPRCCAAHVPFERGGLFLSPSAVPARSLPWRICMDS